MFLGLFLEADSILVAAVQYWDNPYLNSTTVLLDALLSQKVQCCDSSKLSSCFNPLAPNVTI